MDRRFWALVIPEFSCQVHGHIIIERIDTSHLSPPLTITVRFWQSWRRIHVEMFVYPYTVWWNSVIRAAQSHMLYDERARELVEWMSSFGPRRNT